MSNSNINCFLLYSWQYDKGLRSSVLNNNAQQLIYFERTLAFLSVTFTSIKFKFLETRIKFSERLCLEVGYKFVKFIKWFFWV